MKTIAGSSLILSILFHSSLLFGQATTLKIADSLAAVGKHKKAISLLENQENNNEKTYLKLAGYQQAIGQDEKALENYRKVLKLNPERILTSIDYGELLINTGKLDQADSLFSSLVDKYPENANFQYRMGLIKERQNDKMFEHYYYRAIGLDSTHQAAIYKVAKTQLQRKKFSNAIALSKKGLEANENNVSLLSILAQSYSVSSQYDKAIPVYERLIDLGEGSEFIYDKLGFAYYRVDDLPMAIKYFKRSLELEDRNSNTHYNLGKIYTQLGELEKAEQHLLMSILIKKQPVDAEFLSLALAYKKMKDYRKAYTYFGRALEENPENERAMLERAIAADAYFVDKKSILKMYRSYLDRYESIGNEQMIAMAEYRISELKKEIHLSE